MIRMLVVHDDLAVHQQLATVLRGEADLTVVGGFTDVAEAKAQLAYTPCEVMLVSATLGFETNDICPSQQHHPNVARLPPTCS